MIRQKDTELSNDQYEKLLALAGDPIFKVVAHSNSPDFQEYGSMPFSQSGPYRTYQHGNDIYWIGSSAEVTNLAVGGTVSAGVWLEGADWYKPANAFDGDNDTMWAGEVGANTWIRYNLPTPGRVDFLALTARKGPAEFLNQSPRSFTLQYYYGGRWNNLLFVSYTPPWAANQRRVWTVPPLPAGVAGHTQWRLVIHSTHGNWVAALADIELIGAGLGNLRIFKMSEGQPWQEVFTNLPAAPTRVNTDAPSLLIDGNRVLLFVAGADGVYLCRSENGGAMWYPWKSIVSFPPGNVYEFTGDLCSGGSSSASSVLGGASYYHHSLAFNNNTNDFWAGGQEGWEAVWSPQWIEYNFGTPRAISKFTITSRYGIEFPDQNPKTFRLQYYNGSAWITAAYYKDVPQWNPTERREYVVIPPSRGIVGASAARWRIYIDETYGSATISIGEIEMMATQVKTAETSMIAVVPTAPDRFYALVRVPQYGITELRAYDLNPVTATATERFISWLDGEMIDRTSRLEFQFLPTSINAERLADGSDLIILGTQMPGDPNWEQSSGQLNRMISTSYGILAFLYTDGFTTHQVIDRVEVVDENHFIEGEKLTAIGDLLVLTARRRDALDWGIIDGLRYYTSKDGIFWSKGEILPFGDAAVYPAALHRSGDHLYAIAPTKAWESHGIYSLGGAAPSHQMDLTGLISDYKLSHSGMLSASMLLDDSEEEFRYVPPSIKHPLINPENRVIFEHFAGIVTPEGEEILTRVGITELDAMDWSHSLPEKTVRLVSRDLAANMTDRAASEQPTYYQSRTISGDDYLDRTDTAHGGLAHTAIIMGGFKTENGSLVVNSENESIGFNTLTSDAWNGIITTRIEVPGGLPTSLVQCYAGIIVRAIDAENFTFLKLDFKNNLIQLGQRINGVDYVMASASHVHDAASSYGLVFKYGFLRGIRINSYGAATPLLTTKQDCSSRQYGPPYNKLASTQPIDSGSGGLFALGEGIKFTKFRYANFERPFPVRDAFKVFSSFAGLHETEFDYIIPSGEDSWSIDGDILELLVVQYGQWGDSESAWDDGVVSWG